MNPALEIHDLCLAYGKQRVLDGVSLHLEAGRRMTVAGCSGSGKTTLLRAIAGLETPERGSIRIDGVTASEGSRQLLPPWKRGLQMVFQDLGLWPTRSVRAHLEDPLRAGGMERLAARARAEEVLERLGLAPLAGRRPGRLSGGEARRLAFARALVLRPRLLLLDEPFASLDPVARADGLALLEEVLAVTEAAVLLVTHAPEEALALGGEIAILRAGRASEARPASELCSTSEVFRQALEG